MDTNPKHNICFVMTATSALRAFMADHIKTLSKHYRVTVCCNFSSDPCNGLFDEEVTLVHIPFERKIHIAKDIKCLLILYAVFRNRRFEIVHSIMPKTGLLAMAASFFSGVPIRIHVFTGQVWVSLNGIWRTVLKLIDRLIAGLATRIYADSPSQRDFLIAENIIRTGEVLGYGSVNGVDTDRFIPNNKCRHNIRQTLGIPQNICLFGILSRLTTDKGVVDTIEAFSIVAKNNDSHLLVVGPDEENIIPWAKSSFPELRKRLHFIDQFTREPETYLAAMDVFCQQSYREGFGSSVILAAACEIPALASRIYGLTDAIEDGISGILHKAGSISEICDGMVFYNNNPKLRMQYGKNARQRAINKFSSKRLTKAMQIEYKKLIRDL